MPSTLTPLKRSRGHEFATTLKSMISASDRGFGAAAAVLLSVIRANDTKKLPSMMSTMIRHTPATDDDGGW
jgi:hypothetical protein